MQKSNILALNGFFFLVLLGYGYFFTKTNLDEKCGPVKIGNNGWSPIEEKLRAFALGDMLQNVAQFSPFVYYLIVLIFTVGTFHNNQSEVNEI